MHVRLCATWEVWGLLGRICEICAAGFPANDGVNFSQATMAWISRKVWREFARIVDYLTSTALLCVKTTASLPPQCYGTARNKTPMKAIKLSDTRIKSNYFETLWLTLKIIKKQQHLHICLICLCSYQSHSSTSSWLHSTWCWGGTRSWSSWSLQPSWLSSQSL